MEDTVGAGADGFVAEYPSGADHPYRKLRFFHCADLHAGRMGTQKYRVDVSRAYEEGVLHISRRVVRREVERLEHVIVVLDLGTLGHIIAELAENIHNLLPYNAYRMTGAEFVAVSRHSQVLC